jgi:hypothetical protein
MMPKKGKHSISLEQQIGNKRKFMIFMIYDFTRKLPAIE